MDWFRWHHGSVTDPKFQLIARKSGSSLPDVLAVWAYVLETASAADDRGHFGEIDAEALDCVFGFPATETRTANILVAMGERKLISNSVVCAWDKRQVKRERDDNTSTERSKLSRERQKQPNQAKPSHATPCNTMQHQETPRGEERREEEIREDKDTQTARVAGEAGSGIDQDPGFPENGPGDFKPSMAAAVCLAIKAAGVASVNPSHPELTGLLERGADIGWFTAAARTAVEKGKGFAYVLGIVRGQLADAQSVAGQAGSAVGTRTGAATETPHARMVRERAEQFAPGIAIRPSAAQNESQPYTIEDRHGAAVVQI